MSDATSRSFSFREVASRGSADSFPTGDYEAFRNKGAELAQAMLSEIEDILRQYDADLGTLSLKSPYYSRDGSKTPAGSDVNELSSVDASLGKDS